MITTYLLTRQELVNLIKNSEKTNDNFYWYPKIDELLLIKGFEDDIEYVYQRQLFKHAWFMNDEIIEIFLSKKNVKNFNINALTTYYLEFHKYNSDIKPLSLNDVVYKKKFKVSELIDCYNIFKSYK